MRWSTCSEFPVTGNDQIGDYQYLDSYGPNGSGQYMGVSGLAPQRLFNPDFAWELVRKIEAGLDLGFFNDRLTFSGAYYRNRSSNQLVGNPLAPTTGFVNIQSNFPAVVQNSGLEFELSLVPIQSSALNWVCRINLTVPRNKLVSFPSLASTAYVNSYVVGEPLNIAKQYNVIGINATTGLYEFEDVNEDGTFSSIDRQTILFRGRKFYAGISNTFEYKSFQLDFLFEFVKQNGPNYLLYYFVPPGSQSNFPEDVMNRWQADDASDQFQQFNTLSPYQAAHARLQSSDRAISDASFIRLKNVALSWNFPDRLLSKIKMENLKILAQAQNLLTITGYKGLDPENQSATLPPLRVITVGLNLTF